jgi:hypothetical protein
VTVWLSAYRLSPSAAPLAAALVALSGQTVITLFGQTAMGLFAALTVGSFCAALYRRYLILAALLMLATLTRPEGALLSALLVGASFIPTFSGRRGAVGFTFAGAMGLFVFALMTFFHSRLTGSLGFTTVAGGVGEARSTSAFLNDGARSLAAMFKEVFFGLADGHRRFYLLPVFGGWLGVMGLLSRRWRRDEITRVETWCLMAIFVVVTGIAFIRPGGARYDHYLAWILPLWFIYVAIGLRQAAGMFPWARAFMFMAAILLLYQAIGLVYFTSLFARDTAALASNIAFARSASERLPEGSRIGVVDLPGMAYVLPGHAVHQVDGRVSPEFINPVSPRANIEVLRHEMQTRFDAWLLPSALSGDEWYSGFVGARLAAEPPALGPDALALYRADWRPLDRSVLPISPSVRQFTYGLGVVDELNVGHIPHEQRADYRTDNRLKGMTLPLVAETLGIEGRPLTEAGRIILGSETMRVRSEPGREMRVVLRTSSVGRVATESGVRRFEFASPLPLQLRVDGRDAGTVTVNLRGSGEFTEVGFSIPAELVTGDSIRLTVSGDHISYAYWFYQ